MTVGVFSSALIICLGACILGLLCWALRLRRQINPLTRDISERKKLETAIRDSEKKYRDIFENTHDSLALLDITADGRFKFADINPVNQRLFNKPYDQIIGAYIQDIFSPDDVVRVQANLTKCVRDGIPLHIEDQFGAGSVTHHIRTSVIPIRDADSAIVRVLVVAHDATDEVQAHQAKLVAERSRHALESQLMESRKLESLGRLAGGVAHDFNNLLGAILGFSEFIQEDAEPDSPIYTHAGRIQTAGLRGKALIQKILTFVRETKLDLQPVDLGLVAHETVDLLAAGFPKSNKITLEIGECGLEILADSHQVGDVLVNLCMNAQDSSAETKQPISVRVFQTDPTDVRYMPLTKRQGRGPVQSLESWTDSDGSNWGYLGSLRPDADYVSVRVSDSGCGMSLELLNKVFEPFFTTKDRAKGTGLGLPVVMGIVLEHKGALLIETRPGLGTTFEVVFSRLAEKTMDKPLTTTTVVTQTDAMDTSLMKRILLIDDNQDFADMLLLALTRQKFEVTMFTDACQGVQHFKQTPQAWDVLITDQTMPDMTGIQVIGEMTGIRRDFPCILISGYDEHVTDESAKQAGASALLNKPLDINVLVETLRNL